MSDEEPEERTSSDEGDPAVAAANIGKAASREQAKIHEQLGPMIELIQKYQRQSLSRAAQPLIEMQQTQVERTMQSFLDSYYSGVGNAARLSTVNALQPVLDSYYAGVQDIMNPGMVGAMQAVLEAQRMPLSEITQTLSVLSELNTEVATTTSIAASATATASTAKQTHQDTHWEPSKTRTDPKPETDAGGIDPVDAVTASIIAQVSIPNYSELDEREQQAVAFVIGGVLTFGVGFLLLDAVTAAKLGAGGGTAASVLEGGRVGRKERLDEE